MDMEMPASTRRRSGSNSMQELSPSPVSESPTSAREGYFAGGTSAPAASKLGLHGHGLAWWLMRIQRYSSYAFSAFATAHLVNTALIPLATRSIPASETYLLLTRPYYQSFPFEPLLVTIPIAAHVGSGIALRLHRRRMLLRSSGAETHKEKKTVPWPRVSGTAALGYALTSLVLPHAFVNRVWPLIKEGGSSGVGLGFVAHGFAKHTAIAWPVYTVLVGVASWHIAWGWSSWLSLESGRGNATEKGLRRKKVRYCVNAAAAFVASLWVAGGIGIVGRGGAAGGWKGREWDSLFHSLPLVGQWF